MPPEHWAAKRALRAHGVRPDPRAVRGAERNSGRMPLRDRLGEDLLRKARHIITGATSWLALHGGLIGLGLRYIRHGRGARIEEAATQETMPALPSRHRVRPAPSGGKAGAVLGGTVGRPGDA